MTSDNLNSKYYKFKDKTDYVFYLAELIADFVQKKDRLEQYRNEIKALIENNPEAKFIQAEIFEPISDKINRVFQYLFNLLGDESKKAVSFRKFRKLLFKQQNILKISIEPLTGEETEILSEFNKLRNWGLHIPDSLYLQKKSFFKMDANFIKENQNIIPIPTYEYWEIEFLSELLREVQEVIDASNLIFERMKSDYKNLIEGDFKIEYEKNQVKPYIFMQAVQNSWDVQKGKLK